MGEAAADPRLVNRVRALRRTRGLTQADLAALLGVLRQTVNAIERGRYDPGLPLAFEIARVFACRIEDVFRPARDGVPDWRAMLSVPATLTGAGVVLRRHRPGDVGPFAAFVADPEAVRWMAFTDAQKTPEGAAALMQTVIESYTGATPVYALAIAETEDGAYLGAAGAADAGPGRAEIFLTLVAQAQGRGLARAALDLLVADLFGRCGLHTLVADVMPQNVRAVRLFEGAGFRREGTVERAAEAGALAHRDMTGVRYVLEAGGRP